MLQKKKEKEECSQEQKIIVHQTGAQEPLAEAKRRSQRYTDFPITEAKTAPEDVKKNISAQKTVTLIMVFFDAIYRGTCHSALLLRSLHKVFRDDSKASFYMVLSLCCRCLLRILCMVNM
jgi:hypothetical protein